MILTWPPWQVESVCTTSGKIHKTLCTIGTDMLDPLGLSVVSAKCTYNISLDHNAFDSRELERLLIGLLVAFYNSL